jgi:hypothetical protein
MEVMLHECLAKVCEAFYVERDLQQKMNLCQEITEFLLSTPDVFVDATSTPRGWLTHLSDTVRHLLQNKLPSDKRSQVFKLASVLTEGFNRIDWFVDFKKWARKSRSKEDKWSLEDRKFFGLFTRLTCIEIVLLLEGISKNSQTTTSAQIDNLGCLLILIEHEMSCLLDVEYFDDDPLHEDKTTIASMSPDEVGSLISNIRGVASNVIDYLILKHGSQEQDNEMNNLVKRSIRDAEGDSMSVMIPMESLCLVRFLCQYLVEDISVKEGQIEGIIPVLLSSFMTQVSSSTMESPAFEHGILSALIVINGVKEVALNDQLPRNSLESFTSSCLLCQEGNQATQDNQQDIPICREFREKILLRES